ncbi:MAG: RnfH family protein [Gammaproteobacteria bacterium]
MRIALVYSPAARQTVEMALDLPEGTTVHAALQACGWLDNWPELLELPVSIWGRKAALGQALREGDRLEWCRALRVDPKVARRERFVGQGARTAGLFSRRRPGSKPGY